MPEVIQNRTSLLSCKERCGAPMGVQTEALVTGLVSTTPGAWVNEVRSALDTAGLTTGSQPDGITNLVLTERNISMVADDPAKAVTTRHVLRTLKEFCAKAGVSTDGVCTHSTRHTVATMIYDATGKDLKAAQELLGHATIATTEKYLHADEDAKRRGVEALDFGTSLAPGKAGKPVSARPPCLSIYNVR